MGSLTALWNALKYLPRSNPRVKKAFSNKKYTDASPYKIIYVDPSKINRCSGRQFNKYNSAGEVLAGNWDMDAQKYCSASFYEGVDSSFHSSLQSRFVDNHSWLSTAFVQEVVKQIENGNRCWGCDSYEQVLEKCAKVDNLYKSIRKDGYLTQEETILGETKFLDPLLSPIISNTILVKDEVAVDISRSGELLFYDGKHRLSISKILDIDIIPVRVSARHQQWQNLRDDIENSTNITHHDQHLMDHPDLVDIK